MNYKGKLLVATPELTRDSTFTGSVVYIYEQTPDVILGLVLNKPTTTHLNDIIRTDGMGYSNTGDILYKGGPVSPSVVLMLHTNEWYSSNTIQIGNGLALSSDEFMFEKIVMGNTPEQYRIMTGISSWLPEQLEQEIHQWKSWLVADTEYDIVFNSEGSEQWQEAITLTSQQTFDQYF
jgi:putative AlgH/UPF0301 family transcriptional regulator